MCLDNMVTSAVFVCFCGQWSQMQGNVSDVSDKLEGELQGFVLPFQSGLDKGGGDGEVGGNGGKCWFQGCHIENPGLLTRLLLWC